MTTVIENQRWVETLVANTEAAGNKVCQLAGSPTMPRWAKDKLMGAHAYIYAAMYFEFIIYAGDQILGVYGVSMDDGTVKTTRQFLTDDVVENHLNRVIQEGGDDHVREWTDKIRMRVKAMIAAHELSLVGGKVESL